MYKLKYKKIFSTKHYIVLLTVCKTYYYYILIENKDVFIRQYIFLLSILRLKKSNYSSNIYHIFALYAVQGPGPGNYSCSGDLTWRTKTITIKGKGKTTPFDMTGVYVSFLFHSLKEMFGIAFAKIYR